MKHTIKSHLPYIFALFFGVFAVPFASMAEHEEGHATDAHATVTNTEAHATEAHGEAGHGEKFNAGRTITEHISDAHGWHVWGEHESAFEIPLPVIIYSDKGLDVFSSKHFHHKTQAYQGNNYIYYLTQDEKVVAVKDTVSKEVDAEATAKLWDVSITKNVVTLFFSITLLLIIFLSVAGAYKRNPNQAPKGIQSFVEPIIIFIRDDVAIPAIGKKKYEKFMPYLLTVFFFILINNLLGLVPVIPGGANLTGNIAITVVLAVMTFIFTTINGNAHYWHHIVAMPGVPKPVLIILTPIEIFGVFLRPGVLAIRLFANITAGHIIALSFFSLIFIFAEMNTGLGFGVGIFSVAFTVFMGLLEILVAFIQAYVFTLLSAIYFGSAVEEPAHH